MPRTPLQGDKKCAVRGMSGQPEPIQSNTCDTVNQEAQRCPGLPSKEVRSVL